MLPRKTTLAGYVYRKGGLRRGQRALLFIAMYGIQRELDGEPVSMARFQETWRVSVATAYRYREAFSIVFPELTVEELWLEIRRHVRSREKVDAFLEVSDVPWAVAG